MGWCEYMGWDWIGAIMIVLWILIIAATISRLILFSSSSDGLFFRYESAIDILKKRYARGEISKQEFEERKKDLE